jgi:hypothetical protein
MIGLAFAAVVLIVTWVLAGGRMGDPPNWRRS